MPGLETEFIAAARTYIGQPAIYHQRFAGNCFEQPSAECLVAGMGPASFDCSGLIIQSASDVLGVSTTDWPADLRHVRDLWSLAPASNGTHEAPQLTVGSLAIMKRQYDIAGQRQVVPGHIGIISDISHEAVTFIHANPEKGVVEERPLRTLTTLMGAMSLDTVLSLPVRISA